MLRRNRRNEWADKTFLTRRSQTDAEDKTQINYYGDDSSRPNQDRLVKSWSGKAAAPKVSFDHRGHCTSASKLMSSTVPRPTDLIRAQKEQL